MHIFLFFLSFLGGRDSPFLLFYAANVCENLAPRFSGRGKGGVTLK